MEALKGGLKRQGARPWPQQPVRPRLLRGSLKPTNPATPRGTAPSCSLLPLSLPLTLLFPPFLSPRPVNGTQGHGSVPQGHPALPDAGLGMGRCTCGAVSLVPVPDPAARWRPGQGAPVPSCAETPFPHKRAAFRRPGCRPAARRGDGAPGLWLVDTQRAAGQQELLAPTHHHGLPAQAAASGFGSSICSGGGGFFQDGRWTQRSLRRGGAEA